MTHCPRCGTKLDATPGELPDPGEIVEVVRPYGYSVAARYLGHGDRGQGHIYVSISPGLVDCVRRDEWRRLPEPIRHDFQAGQVISCKDRARGDVARATP